ncbi:MAG: tetratricopeptide repeat protein [Candidatus Anammoxibacter sp.]
MAKKKKNKKIKKNVPLDQLEQMARDDLLKGRYRKAKDGFKELCRHNREKYLPELIKSYSALSKQMLENGQTTEAQIVINHIKTLDPDFNSRALETQIVIKKGDNEAVINEYVKYLSSGGNDLDKADIIKAADMMVTSFRDFPLLLSSRPELNSELLAVRDAIESVSVEKFDDALDIIRKIKRNSIFSHWRLFVKGMVAFYLKDDGKAKEAFAKLEDNTLPLKAAKPFLLIMNNGDFQKQRDKDLSIISKRACMLTGWSEFTESVSRADYLWRVGRYCDSFQHMLDKHLDFPAEGTGLTASLTKFFYNAITNMPDKTVEKFISYLFGNNNGWHNKNDLGLLLAKKLEVLYFEDYMDERDIVESWEEFLLLYEKIYGENKKLIALVFAHLGSIFAKVEAPDRFSFFSAGNANQLRNTTLAFMFLEKSIECNEKDRDVYIELFKVYEYTKEKSKFNKLLDVMIKRFPEDKEIFVKTGTACINRKVYLKGVKYLEQALKLDPLDSNTKEDLIIGYLRFARSNFKKKKIAAGGDSFKRAIELGSAESQNFTIGRAYIYARWAGLEFASGDDGAGNKMMQTSKSLNAQRFTLLYFTLLIFKAYEVPSSFIEGLGKEVNDEFDQNPTAGNVLQLLKVIEYVNLLGPFSWLPLEKNRVKHFVVKSVRNKKDKCSRNVAREIVQLVISEQKNCRFNKDYTVAQVYIKKMLGVDKKDPQFLFYAFMLKNVDLQFERNRKDLSRIKKILALAEERNEAALIKDIRREITEIERMIDNPFSPEYENGDDSGKEKDLAIEELLDIFGGEVLGDILNDLEIESGIPPKRKCEPTPPKEKYPGEKPKYRQLEFEPF